MSAVADRIDAYTMRYEALVLVLNQVIHGTGSCVHCKQDATVSLGSGAAPNPRPMCWKHARAYIEQTLRMGDDIWAAK